MSSETSTETVRLRAPSAVEGKPDATSDGGIAPWQFFVLAALGCATAALFATRGQGIVAVVLLTILMGATALVGIAALRMLRPLVLPHEDRTSMIGERTKAALEREKMLALRAIKELEFDRAMGKLSDEDWREMSGRLRARASRLMRQLDAGAGYRDQIERDLAKRLGQATPDLQGPAYVRGASAGPAGAARGAAGVDPQAGAVRGADLSGPPVLVDASDPLVVRRADLSGPPAVACAACATVNDPDAKFCKNCGQKL